ncbi:MAG: hypothetical protein WC408_03285 [Candidatus Micrarchaeia archaeon]|jgi:hypothetical protein
MERESDQTRQIGFCQHPWKTNYGTKEPIGAFGRFAEHQGLHGEKGLEVLKDIVRIARTSNGIQNFTPRLIEYLKKDANAETNPENAKQKNEKITLLERCEGMTLPQLVNEMRKREHKPDKKVSLPGDILMMYTESLTSGGVMPTNNELIENDPKIGPLILAAMSKHGLRPNISAERVIAIVAFRNEILEKSPTLHEKLFPTRQPHTA